MATFTLQGRRGELRIYDGTATPNYIILPWCQTDWRSTLNRGRPEPVYKLDRGRLNNNAHQIFGDDMPIIQAVPVTFSAELDEQTLDDVLAALSNPFRLATWTVGTGTFTNTNGKGASILNGDNALAKVPQPVDNAQDRVHVEMLFSGKVAGTNDRGFRHEEVWFPPDLQNVQESLTGLLLSCTYWCFGKMTLLTTFSAGTNVTPVIV